MTACNNTDNRSYRHPANSANAGESDYLLLTFLGMFRLLPSSGSAIVALLEETDPVTSSATVNSDVIIAGNEFSSLTWMNLGKKLSNLSDRKFKASWK